MAYPYSSEVARFNPQRRAIYTMLLNTAGREWTVATLTASLRGSVPADAVRSSLDTLLAHGGCNSVHQAAAVYRRHIHGLSDYLRVSGQIMGQFPNPHSP